tara:strand:- start:407 stop:832 length:426 start_codon:yes stop_codon:yes gene_type:complete
MKKSELKKIIKEEISKILGTKNNKFEEWLNSFSKYQDSDIASGSITWGELKKEMIDEFNSKGNADSVFKKYGMRGARNTYIIGGYVGDKVTLKSTPGEFIEISTGMGTISPRWDYSTNSGTAGEIFKDFSNQVYPPGSRMD